MAARINIVNLSKFLNFKTIIVLDLNQVRISRLSFSLQREIVYSATLFTPFQYCKTVLLENKSYDSSSCHVTEFMKIIISPSGFFNETQWSQVALGVASTLINNQPA